MIYASDFETNNYESSCYVYLWGLMNIDDGIMIHGNTIKSYFKKIKELRCEEIYFHNLKFDASFMVDYLLKNGFIQNSGHYDFKKKKMILQPRSFDVGINKQGIVYYVKIQFTSNHSTMFYDFYKILSMKLEKIPETIGLDATIKKGDYDYTSFRDEEHQPTDEELDYLYHDLEILRQGILFKQGMDINEMTFASFSIRKYKETFVDNTSFRKIFPVIDPLVYSHIYDAYRGGYVYLAKKAEVTYDHVHIYDVNSLYPAVLMYDVLPYGKPLYFNGKYTHDDDYPLYIQVLSCNFTLKPGKHPTIQIKDRPLLFRANEYVKECFDNVMISLTNIDLDLFFDHYDVYDTQYLGGYKFKSSNTLFKNYIKKNNEIKEASDGVNPGLREVYKLLSNSLYGKFGENPEKEKYIPVLKNNSVRYVEKKEELKITDGVYLPVAVFTTSHARRRLFEVIDVLEDQFIYCDTDSVHFQGEEPWELLQITDPKKIGFWACERENVRAKYIGPKSYIYEHNEKLIVKSVGMTDEIKEKVTFDNFKIGTIYQGARKSKVVNGGTLITTGEFELKRR